MSAPAEPAVRDTGRVVAESLVAWGEEAIRIGTTLATKTSWVEWILFGGVLVLGATVLVILHRWALPRLVTHLERRKVPGARAIGRALGTPLTVVTAVYFLNMGKSVFSGLPGWLWLRIEHLVSLIYGVTVLVFVFRAIDIAMEVLAHSWRTEGSDLDVQLIRLIERTCKGVALAIALLIVLDSMGVSVIGLVTGLGFLGAAVALASQSTIANILGSITVLADRMFRVGDRIQFGAYDGFVTEMGLLSVELTSLYGDRLKLPNKDVADQQLRNFSRGRFVRTAISVGITYDTPRAKVERALTVLEQCAASLKGMAEVPDIDRVETGVAQLDASQITLDLIVWADYRTSAQYRKLVTALNLAVKEAFDREGITFAFPTQTIHLAPPPSPSS
jgi:small-conductance mechanosensitive channel